MKQFCGVGILGGLVLVGMVNLAGCSNAAREASNNDAPVAQITLTTANAPAHVGTVLQAHYQYSDADGDAESGTVKAWLRDGQPIEGATQDIYTATVQDSGKKLQFRVTPAAASGKTPGAAVASSAITIENSAPSVTNVVIGGSVNGQTDGRVPLTVSYSFYDLDGDGQEASTYQWRRDGVAIGDATEKTYTPRFSDEATTLTVAVKPSAHTGASPGLEVESNPVKVATDKVKLNMSADLKQLRFSWYPVTKATYYRVLYRLDGVSEFVPVSTDSSSLTTTTYDWDIAVHRINWPKAQFMLEACDANNTCKQSASISALDVMLDTIGYFKASNTGAYDYFGISVALSADGNTLAVGAPYEDSAKTGVIPGAPDAATTGNTASSGAVYVYTRSGATWSQQAYVKASNTGAGDGFGLKVALSADGNTLAVGAYGEGSAKSGITPGAPDAAATPNDALGTASGAVYVYARSGAAWAQQAYVKASNTGAGDGFGLSVTLSGDGDTLAVGARGEDGAKTGVIPGAPDAAATPNDALGADFGAVYVYVRSGATWSQQAYVKASNTGASDAFGWSVALSADGNTLAVGTPSEDSATTGVITGAPVETDTPDSVSGISSGAVYLYARSGAMWSQQAYVKASNTGADDLFGTSVALSSDGNTLAVGAYGEDSAKTGITPGAPDEAATGNDALGSYSGAVYIYARSGAMWSQQAYVKASNTRFFSFFGNSVALSADGNTLACGAHRESSVKTGVIPGAPDAAATGNGDSGAVYVYARSGATWSQEAYVKASNTGGGDYFGRSVALSTDGNTLAVGASLEESAATGVNNTTPGQGDNSAPDAGAVYLY